MKWILNTVVYLLLTSCDAFEVPVPNACRTSIPVAVEAIEELGTVRFDDRFSQFTIRSAPAFPHIDTQWTHLICDFPEELQQEGLEVVFSGPKRPFNDEETPSIVTGGEEFFTIQPTMLKNAN